MQWIIDEDIVMIPDQPHCPGCCGEIAIDHERGTFRCACSWIWTRKKGELGVWHISTSPIKPEYY